jgi:excisionase family DNA binding protein
MRLICYSIRMARKLAQQLELEVATTKRPEQPHRRHNGAATPAKLGPRLALSPDEAAGVLGVSRDYLDEHVIGELRIVRRGRRILIALAELERWLDQAAGRTAYLRP